MSLMNDLAEAICAPLEKWRRIVERLHQYVEPYLWPSTWTNWWMDVVALPTDLDLPEDQKRILVLEAIRTWTSKGPASAIEAYVQAAAGITANVILDPPVEFIAGVSLAGDPLGRLFVQSRSLDGQPSNPTGGGRYGVRYIVGPFPLPAPFGAWAGRPRDIAEYTGSGWRITDPPTGTLAWVEDEQALIEWDGDSWEPFVDDGSATPYWGFRIQVPTGSITEAELRRLLIPVVPAACRFTVTFV